MLKKIFLKRFSEVPSRSILQNIVLHLWSKNVKHMRKKNNYLANFQDGDLQLF